MMPTSILSTPYLFNIYYSTFSTFILKISIVEIFDKYIKNILFTNVYVFLSFVRIIFIT